MGRQHLLTETLITLPASGNVIQILGQDWRRVWAALWAPATVPTLYISTLPTVNPATSAQLSSANPNGPLWEMYLERTGIAIQHEWWLYGGGMAGSNQLVVMEGLEWDDGRDDGLLLPTFAADPHTLQPGIDTPDRMAMLVSELRRLTNGKVRAGS